jgi:hypothetical protein
MDPSTEECLKNHWNFHELKKSGTMNPSIFFVLGAILLAFILYTVVRDYIFGKREYFEINRQPGEAALEIRQLPVEGPRTVMPSGPNSPSQSPPDDEEVRYGEPHAVDPYADRQQAADAEENMRYPERSFRPSVDNDQTMIAREAGIAGSADQTSPQAYQKFNTEGIQNSGSFMDGVYANDVGSDANFSAF